MAVDVSKAITAISGFGCEAGYESPGMFIVIVPSPDDSELDRVIPVSVHELKWISGAADADKFKRRLNRVSVTSLSKLNSAIPAHACA
jgi:hypothetical protein